ncbi:hypothetical protein [Dysgonomonas macrotermitis]|uniref:Uncharacterized protein n=1 Tax=Dysgonomonas macrotermitis TaxID=1346286 RepID=A0A1M5JHH9_9BACT|nr:hypothetical protein [Dysgonomonas macrotermitis]SHG39991.1 hypothetical protein SAMN05444362_12411 [Dysgonomonas macrotermitis]
MKSSAKTVLVIIFCCICGGFSAQNINIYFPYMAGKEYVFILNSGIATDTVQSGFIGETSRLTLIVPDTMPLRHLGNRRRPLVLQRYLESSDYFYLQNIKF